MLQIISIQNIIIFIDDSCLDASNALKVVRLEHVLQKKKTWNQSKQYSLHALHPQSNHFPQLLHRCSVFVFLCSCYLSADGSKTTHLACLSFSYISTDQPRSVRREDRDETPRVRYYIRRDKIMFPVQKAWRNHQPDAQKVFDSSSLALRTKSPSLSLLSQFIFLAFPPR